MVSHENLCYLQRPKSLLVCDSDRLVLLDPKNGNILRLLPVLNFCRLISMSLYDDNLNLYNKKPNDTKIDV